MNTLYKRFLSLAIGGTLFAPLATAIAYPVDGYSETNIRRLEYYRLAQNGEIKGKKLLPGAQFNRDQIVPRLLGDADNAAAQNSLALPEINKKLSQQIKSHIVQQPHNYSVALLDLSEPDNPIYAEHNGDYVDNVGSIGKILVAVAFFAKLKEIYPDDIEKRRSILKNTQVTADKFSVGDHHKVRFWDTQKKSLKYRTIRQGDRANLYEYLDWALSPSSNAASAMVQRELILLSHFKDRYPVAEDELQEFLKTTKKTELGDIFLAGMIEPLKELGINTDKLRQGSFFTRAGKNRVIGTNSVGNPRELVKLLYLMEKGQLIDEFSSTELKRLLYSTERRIRYASHPVLNPFAVYFKSGSLYSCKPEEGFSCGKYKGNKRNVLASVAIVEVPDQESDKLKHHYIAVVQSKVLKINSAVAHQTLALRIHRLVEKLHKQK